MFFLNITQITGDEYMYVYCAKALHQGKYTHWIILKEYVPDTFRNPGYAFFIYLIQFISDSVSLIKTFQLALFFATIVIFLKIIELYKKNIKLKNTFLILLNINFVVLAYPGYIFPETLMLFLITLIVYIELKWKNESWLKIIGLVLLYSYAFQVRPVILFIPFIRIAYYLYKKKWQYFSKEIVFILLFIASLLPYGYWNYKTHGIFKVTPIEGGAGVMYLGYWSPKMIEYTERKYWYNKCPKDILINFSDEKESLENRKIFDREWDSIVQVCSKYLTAKDSLLLPTMLKHDYLFVTYNGKYTNEREKIIKQVTIKHLITDWQYTIKLKLYTVFRMWYSGLNINDLHSKNYIIKYSSILAFLTTFITCILFFGYFTFCLIRRRDILLQLMLPIFLCVYFDILHLPFVIQSRYTIAVRMFYLFTMTYMIFAIHFKDKKPQEK